MDFRGYVYNVLVDMLIVNRAKFTQQLVFPDGILLIMGST